MLLLGEGMPVPLGVGGVTVGECPVPVGLEEGESVMEELEEVETLEVEPVAQEDFPCQASLGMLLATAEPTRAAKKSDVGACMVGMILLEEIE